MRDIGVIAVAIICFVLALWATMAVSERTNSYALGMVTFIGVLFASIVAAVFLIP